MIDLARSLSSTSEQYLSDCSDCSDASDFAAGHSEEQRHFSSPGGLHRGATHGLFGMLTKEIKQQIFGGSLGLPDVEC